MRAGIAVIAASVALTSMSARGQTSSQPAPPSARADALFTEAKALRDGGRYAEACAEFAESNRLAPGVGVTLYLGDCYAHVGKTASAWGAFRAAEKRAREKNDDRARIADARAKELEPRLSRIALVVPPSLRRPGVEIAIDGGVVVPPEEYAAGVAADPGDHLVTLKLGGRVARTQTAHVAANGTKTSVVLQEPPLPADFFAVKAAPAGERAKADLRSAVGVTLLMLGGAGLATGAILLSEKNRSMTDGSPDGSPTYDHGAAAVSAIAFAIAGTAFASAVVLYLTTPKRSEASAFMLAPMPLAGGGGAFLEASF